MNKVEQIAPGVCDNYLDIFKKTESDDIFGLYLCELRNLPRMSNAQKKQLLLESKTNKNSKKLFLEQNLGLVISVVSKYFPCYVDILDLIQEGNIALNKAIELFNPSLGNEFSTYAYHAIRNNIITYLNKSQKKHNHLSLEEDINNIEEINNKPNKSNKTLMEILPDISNVDLNEQVEESNIKEVISNLINRINKPRWKAVLELRYGFRDGMCYTYEEIGVIINTHRSRVEQIDKALLKNLNNCINKNEVEDYLIKSSQSTINCIKDKSKYSSKFLFGVEKLRRKLENRDRDVHAIEIDDVPNISFIEKEIFKLKYYKKMSNNDIKNKLKLTDNLYTHNLNSLKIKIFLMEEDRRYEENLKTRVNYSKSFLTIKNA